jgi:hypothetical protein
MAGPSSCADSSDIEEAGDEVGDFILLRNPDAFRSFNENAFAVPTEPFFSVGRNAVGEILLETNFAGHSCMGFFQIRKKSRG